VDLALPFFLSAPDLGCFELAPFEDWIGARQPGVVDPARLGETADPDSDGVANLVEYFAGSDPLVPDAPAPITLKVSEAGGIHLNARRQKLASGIAHRVEHSSNLATWSVLAVELSEEQDLAGHVLLGAEIPLPSAAGFWRLSVSRLTP
jgi:hypothetical protein